jgi:predicted metal-dependent hydrolase
MIIKVKAKFRKTFRRSRKEYLKNKERVRGLVGEKLKYYNKFYNLSWQKVSIRNQKKRWGSCSRKGNLNFNYKIIFLPPRFADYIIVHELCHLKEFNHSKNFWRLVSKIFPDYREIIRELKQIRLKF